MVVAAARAVPDQIVTAVFGFEELREDCGSKAGVVELPRSPMPRHRAAHLERYCKAPYSAGSTAARPCAV